MTWLAGVLRDMLMEPGLCTQLSSGIHLFNYCVFFFDIALIGSTRWRNHSNHEVCGEAFCRVSADLVVMYMLLIDQDVSSSVNFAPYLLSMKHE